MASSHLESLFGPALPPRDGSLPDLDIFGVLLNRPGGPVASSEVLAELAEVAPRFARAKGGEPPEFGVDLDGEGPIKPEPPAFVDLWYVPMGAARWR